MSDHLKLPAVDFYQLRVRYSTILRETAVPSASIGAINANAYRLNAATTTRTLTSGETTNEVFHDEERGELADFAAWLLHVAKGSFGAVTLPNLRAFAPELRAVFDAITFDDRGVTRFNALYDEDAVAGQVRLAFYHRRELSSREDVLHTHARLLLVEKLAAIAADKKNLYPSEADTEQMREMDTAGQSPFVYAQTQRAKQDAVRETLIAQGLDPNLFTLPSAELTTALTNKERSFHFAPYSFDSGFELKFLQEALTLEALRDRKLEIYFNGAGELTEFRVDCYARRPHGWNKVGVYTPDFLLVERKDSDIYRALIIETKGSGFADQKAFVARRKFMSEEFLRMNNEKFGYPRFDYLYLSDSDEMTVNLRKLCDTAARFFTE